MKLSQDLYEALNDQVQAEFHSAYLYMAMAGYFEDANFDGFATWMKAQAKEEMEHGLKIYNYLFERGTKPVLKTLEAPPSQWQSPLDAFQAALEHERYISSRIVNLMELAIAHKDQAAVVFLNWFINEQVEEEDNVSKIVAKLEMVGQSIGGMFQLDYRLGKRDED